MRRPLPTPSWSLRRFLGETASSRPVPGGGSATALGGALGCALGGMAARILLSRKGLPQTARRCIQRELLLLERLLRDFQRLITEDARAYRALVDAQRLPAGQAGTRRGIPRAKRRAMETPLRMVRAAREAHRGAARLLPYAGSTLRSDLKAAQFLLQASWKGALEMVKINQRNERQ